MVETPVLDLLSEVDRARAELGLEPLTAAGWRGFPDLDIDFLRRKAEEQLRNRFGRWVKERGSLDLEPEGRGTLLGDRPRNLQINVDSPEVVTHDPKWGQVEPPKPPPKPPPQVLLGTDVEELLAKVGEDARTQKHFGRRYAIVTRDGVHMVAVPMANVDRGRAFKKEGQTNMALARSITNLKEQQREFERNGDPVPQGLLDEMNRLTAEREQSAERMMALSESMGQVGPSAPSPESLQMATDALDELEEAAKRMPEWRQRSEHDGTPVRSLRIDLDQSLFDPDVGGLSFLGLDPSMVPDSTVAGFTYIGSHAMALNPSMYYQDRYTGLPPGTMMPAGWLTKGPYTISHELGHVTDERDSVWGSETRPDVWEQAKATGQLSRYGYDSVYEGYAEAFAMWMSGQKDHPVAKLYADAFGWDEPSRPAIPPGSVDNPDYQPPLTADDWTDLRKFSADQRFSTDEVMSMAYKYIKQATEMGDLERLRTVLELIREKGFV